MAWNPSAFDPAIAKTGRKRPARRAEPTRRRRPVFENIRADYIAHGRKLGAQGFWAMTVYRFGRWRYGIAWRPLRMPFSFAYHLLYKWIQIVAGIEIPCEARVGRNFVIDHFGQIIVSGYAVIGDNCRIRNGVCIGLARVDQPGAPIIGNNVDVGAGAKVLGRIRIGNNVLIGANAVVTRDVPDNCVAAGVPAVIRPRRSQSGAMGAS